jgi:hypothetical protein
MAKAIIGNVVDIDGPHAEISNPVPDSPDQSVLRAQRTWAAADWGVRSIVGI